MTELVIKYNGTPIDDVKMWDSNDYTDGKGDAVFFVENEGNINLATWKARRFGEKIECFKSDGTTLRWSGRVISVGSGHPLMITCLGILDDMERDIMSELEGKMIVDSFIVPNDPPGSANNWTPTNVNLRVVNDDDDQSYPGLGVGQYNKDGKPRYAIVSDNTAKETTATLLSESSVITNGAAFGGTTHTNTQVHDGMDFGIEVTSIENDAFHVILKLDVQNDNISTTSEITKIGLKIVGTYSVDIGNPADHPPNVRMEIGWSKNQTTFAPSTWNKFWTARNDITPTDHDILVDWELPITDISAWFDNAGGEFTKGAIIFSVSQNTYPDAAAAGGIIWNIDFVEVKVYYSTATFEVQNRKIEHTLPGGEGLYDILRLFNDAGSAAYNLNGKGINSLDRVDIGIGVLEALNRCNTRGFELEVNKNVDPNVGTTQNYVGVGNYVGFAQISRQQGYIYFIDRQKNIDILKTLLPADIDYNYFLIGDTVATENNEVITLTSATGFTEDALAGLELVVTAGDQSGNSYTIASNTAGGNITLTEDPPDNILGDTVDIRWPRVTYSKDNDPPEWWSNIDYEDDLYGYVVVQYYQGALTGKIGDGTPDRTILEDAEWILTKTEAIRYGGVRATFHASDRISINLKWGKMPSNFPYVGVKFSFTDLLWNGTSLDNNSFTDRICRRVNITWEGGLAQAKISAWLGLGQTPAEEKLARWEANVDRNQRILKALQGTAQYNPISRHNQLLGIGSGDHHTPTVGSDLAHDDITLPQGNAEEQHMTAAQITALHATYTNAQALAIVNATGLALANTKVITSQDADLTFTFGRAQIDSRFSDMMTISHRDMSAQDNYAFGQTSSGSTYINAPTGQLIHLHINDIMKMSLSTGSLSMAVPIAMGANKITGLANGTVATNAMAFGQKYTSADVIAALTALGFTVADTGGEFKITHKDKNSANNVTVFHDGTTYLWNNNTAPSWFAWEINSGRKADINILGLRLGGTGARISVFDTSTLVASDTKVPTNTTVKEYVDNRADNKAYPHQIFPGGGAVSWFITGTVYQNGGVFHPTSTVGAVSAWMIKIPDGATGTFNLKVHHWSTTSSTYSGTWTVSAFSPTENRTSDNILNASNAYDLTSPASRVFAVKTIPMSGVAGGDVVNIEFKSDASNGGNCIIHALHIEWT